MENCMVRCRKPSNAGRAYFFIYLAMTSTTRRRFTRWTGTQFASFEAKFCRHPADEPHCAGEYPGGAGCFQGGVLFMP